MKPLSRANLRELPAGVSQPGYLDQHLKSGIVHLGVGNFHKAHQAWYTNAVLNRQPGDWLITGASLRSDVTPTAMARQDNLYALLSHGSDQPVQAEVVGSIAQTLGPGQGQELMNRLTAADTRIVSLTVTEKGYYLTAAGSLDANHPDIQSDLQSGSAATIYGLLMKSLADRALEGRAPYTILSCDNLAANGPTLKQALVAFAALQDDKLAAWIEREVSCPPSMVDRIVPASTDETRATIAAQLNLRDDAGVVTEAFSQWVITDEFPLGRPVWDDVGVIFSSEVRQFEAMKLGMLNGAHSAIAYLGCYLGLPTVADCTRAFGPWLQRFMRQEILPNVERPAGFGLIEYSDALLRRFANESLHHRCEQIAMDGSQKLPQRWFPILAERLAKGTPVSHYALALAAWMLYLGGRDQQGGVLTVSDPEAERLHNLAQPLAGEPVSLAHAVINDSGLFPQALQQPTFIAEVAAAIGQLRSDGLAALKLDHE